MKLQILSDLHLEFHPDGGWNFLSKLNPAGIDALVIAGDLGVGSSLDKLCALCEKYKHVIFVTGNHEYYGYDIPIILNAFYSFERAHSNFHFLENSSVEIEGRNFIGTTLWFRDHPGNKSLENMLSDFSVIKDFTKVVYKMNNYAIEFLNKNIREDSIVVTHHLPTYESVATVYKNSPLNAFFVCDMEDLILEKKPKIWIHGHTHDSFNYTLDNTRIICNPFGYYGNSINKNFNRYLTIDI